MKGKDIFTAREVESIKKLITEKIQAPSDRQKGIRDRIRKMGFYFSKYSSKKGYTVADFEELIRSGNITVAHDSVNNLTKTFKKSAWKPVSHQKIPYTDDVPKITEVNLTNLMAELERNRFDPMSDAEHHIPNRCGNYILCLRKGTKLPPAPVIPVLSQFGGLEVIYTGIAGGSLRTRDYRQHFKGNNAGQSTLRKSLGVLFGYKLVPRDKDPNTGKTKFSEPDESKLTHWMCNNLIMFYLPTDNYKKNEKLLIQKLNPPLNLKGNISPINFEYRKHVSRLRSRKDI